MTEGYTPLASWMMRAFTTDRFYYENNFSINTNDKYTESSSAMIFVFPGCSLSCGTRTTSLCPEMSCFRRLKVLTLCSVCWQRRLMQSCWTLQVWGHSQLNGKCDNSASKIGVCLYFWCLPAGPNLKVLSTMSVGFDHLSLGELKKRCFLFCYFKAY